MNKKTIIAILLLVLAAEIVFAATNGRGGNFFSDLFSNTGNPSGLNSLFQNLFKGGGLFQNAGGGVSGGQGTGQHMNWRGTGDPKQFFNNMNWDWSSFDRNMGNMDSVWEGVNREGEIEDISEVVDFNDLKQRILDGMDRVSQRLDDLIVRIENSNLDQTKKEELLNKVEEIKTELVNFRQRVEAAQTTEELIEILEEMHDYLKEHKGDMNLEINQYVGQRVRELSGRMSGHLDDLEGSLSAMLEKLKENCPPQTQEIEALEQELGTLRTKIDEVQSLIDSNADPEVIKEKMDEVRDLVQEKSEILRDIFRECKSEMMPTYASR